MNVNDLVIEIKKYNPNADFVLVQKAYGFAAKAHGEQLRKSGEPYIAHPLAVAMTLARLRLNSKTIAAGLLHDVVDDTPVKIEEIEKEFGDEIAFMVDGVSKLGQIKYRGVEGQAVKLRKMFLAMAKDIRVVLIKLADRLHNLRTLKFLPENKRNRIALEALEIYAPLAYRLGMWRIKSRLEDTAFPYVYPDKYKWLLDNIKDRIAKREKYLDKVKNVLQEELKKAGVPILDMHLRAKHFYSLYKKLLRYDMDLNKIYDLIALRIITDTIENCYAALGAIHKLWRPLPGRIKDYIAVPKPNGYQSIHTTVFSLEGKIVEIQIRTEKMHEEAEFGIAAHWHYTERKGLKEYIKQALRLGSRQAVSKAPETEIAWVKQLQEWQKEAQDPEEFLKGLKIDFFGDRIFVLTPRGDVVDLPEEATGVDFAYAIHTDLGNRCVGIKANGKLIPLDQPLKSGQIVEILVQKTEKPSRDWLRFVKTSQARAKIKRWFKIIDEESAPQTKIAVEKYLQPQVSPKKKAAGGRIIISGQDSHSKISIHPAKCCQPKSGDPIKGYITLTRGISVHRADCKNLKRIKNKDKFVDVFWQNE
jgi:GTP pyrophosphokinase